MKAKSSSTSIVILILAIIVVAALVYYYASPGYPSTNQTNTTNQTGPMQVIQHAFNPNVNETIVEDMSGRTLYTFAIDSVNASVCYGACANAWPPLIIPAGVTPIGDDRLDKFQRTTGEFQVTYEGLPLYYFAGDVNPGDTKGNNLTGFGGLWTVVT